MMPELIDISNGLPPFNHAKWIGTGRRLPDDPDKIPIGFQLFCDTLLEVPEEFKASLFPDKKLSAMEFLKVILPKQSHQLPQVPVKTCFTLLPVNTDPEDLDARVLPPLQFINNALEYFCQAVSSGVESIEYPTYPGSRLPLWTISYTKTMYQLHDIQKRWRSGTEWVDKYLTQARSPQLLFETAHCYLNMVRWNEPTEIPGSGTGTTTHDFATYLSDDLRMNDSHINMMFSHLGECVEQDDTLDAIVVVETLRFMREINMATSADYFRSSPTRSMSRLEQRLELRGADTMIFPVFLESQSHWLTFKLDIEKYELSYGERGC
jgi:hypothetical protein